MMGERDWFRRTVFRVCGLPNSVQTPDDVASLLSTVLGDLPSDQIHVYSLATALDCDRNEDYPPSKDYHPSKVATVMLSRSSSLFDDGRDKNEWSSRLNRTSGLEDITFDTHFMGMTPLNDVDPVRHSSE